MKVDHQESWDRSLPAVACAAGLRADGTESGLGATPAARAVAGPGLACRWDLPKKKGGGS